jgi:mono/diheme cytochrome c family protein
MTVKRTCILAALLSLAAATFSSAADSEGGRRLAQQRCATCHITAPHQRADVATSPPFEAIGRKYDFDADAITAAVLAPHPRMNLTLRPSEARDIAAYIATLHR